MDNEIVHVTVPAGMVIYAGRHPAGWREGDLLNLSRRTATELGLIKPTQAAPAAPAAPSPAPDPTMAALAAADQAVKAAEASLAKP